MHICVSLMTQGSHGTPIQYPPGVQSCQMVISVLKGMNALLYTLLHSSMAFIFKSDGLAWHIWVFVCVLNDPGGKGTLRHKPWVPNLAQSFSIVIVISATKANEWIIRFHFYSS